MANKKNSFYIQGIILAAASVLSRILGLLFKVPLVIILGDEGMGVYQLAYSIYNIGLLLTTYGMPTAVMKLISEREKKKQYYNTYRVMFISTIISTILGAVMALIIFFGADIISIYILKSPATAIPLRALAPTIFVFAIMGCLRGFFQGKSTVLPTSISQILEQIVHVGVGLGLTVVFMRMFSESDMNYAYGAAGATLGTFIGALVSLLFLGAIYLMYRPYMLRRVRKDATGSREGDKEIVKLVALTAIPIMANQFLYNLTSFIDGVIFNNILDFKDIDVHQRQALWGIYSGKFVQLTSIPIAIAAGIGIAIIPAIVTAYVEGNRKNLYEKMHQAIKFNMMIAIPSAAGLIALARPILYCVLRDQSDEAALLMYIGGISVVLYAYSTTTNSILQGINKLYYPIIHAVIGILMYLLVDIPMLIIGLGVNALAIGYSVFPAVIAVLNWCRLESELRYRQEIIKTFVMPGLSSLIMGILAYIVYNLMLGISHSAYISLAVAIILAILIYVFLMVFTGAVSRKEMYEFPMGGRIVRILDRCGLHLKDDEVSAEDIEEEADNEK